MSKSQPSNPFVPAVREKLPLRLSIVGASGSGKTYTGMLMATKIAELEGGKIAVLDTEGRSARKYAGEFSFDVLDLSNNYDPQQYVDAIFAAERYGYAVLLIDSFSQAWDGAGGVLDIVDGAGKKMGGNDWAGWSKGRPAQNSLVNAILNTNIHLIGTMRAKTDWVLEVDARGKSKPVKVGLAPVQSKDLEYEFDVVLHMEMDHSFLVSKSRCKDIPVNESFTQPLDVANVLHAWVSNGEAPPLRINEQNVLDLKADAALQHEVGQNALYTALRAQGAQNQADYNQLAKSLGISRFSEFNGKLGDLITKIKQTKPIATGTEGEHPAEDSPLPSSTSIDEALDEAYEVKRVEFIKHAGKRRRNVLYRISLDGSEDLGLDSVYAYAEHIEAFIAAGYADYNNIDKHESLKPLVMLRQSAIGYRIVSIQQKDSDEWIDVKPKHAPEQFRVEIIKLEPTTVSGTLMFIAHLHGGKTFDIYPTPPKSKRPDQIKLLRDAGYGEWLVGKTSDWTNHPIQALVDPRGDNWKLLSVQPREDDEFPDGHIISDQKSSNKQNSDFTKLSASDVLQTPDGKKDFANYLRDLNVTDDSKYFKPLGISRWSEFSGKYTDLKAQMQAIKDGPHNEQTFIAAVKSNTFENISKADIERHSGMTLKHINEHQCYAQALKQTIAMFEAEMNAEKAKPKSETKPVIPTGEVEAEAVAAPTQIIIKSLARRTNQLVVLIPAEPAGKEIRMFSRKLIKELGTEYEVWAYAIEVGKSEDIPEDLAPIIVDSYEDKGDHFLVKSLKAMTDIPF